MRLSDEKITVSVIPCNLLHKVVADVLISTESFGSSPYQRCLSYRPFAQMDLSTLSVFVFCLEGFFCAFSRVTWLPLFATWIMGQAGWRAKLRCI